MVFDLYPYLAAPSYWDTERDEAIYDFSSYDMSALKEYWVMIEQIKNECHPESGFQSLFDSEMRQLKDAILKLKNK